MPDTVDFEDRVLDPNTGLGVQVNALTIEIFNRNKQLQDTLVFPAGIAEVVDAGGYLYRVSGYDVSDKVKFPGTFLLTRWHATTGVGQLPSWVQTVNLVPGAMPVIPQDREPYIDLLEAEEFFQTRLDYVDWDRFDAVNQQRALVAAADNLDGERYKGMKIRFFETDTTRQWPRTLPYEEATASFFQGFDRIPKRIRWANAVQALYLLKQIERGHDWEMRRDMQLKGLTGVQRGKNAEQWDLAHAARTAICQEAYEFLHPFLAQAIDNMPVY